MPEDLRAGPGVTLVTMFGNSSRFNGVDPRCTLVGDDNPATGQFKIQQNCMQQGGQSIVQQMNSLIAKGVVITTGLEEGSDAVPSAVRSRSTLRPELRLSVSMTRNALFGALTLPVGSGGQAGAFASLRRLRHRVSYQFPYIIDRTT